VIGHAARPKRHQLFLDLGAGPMSSWPRQDRRLTWIELHVEGGQKRYRPGIISHEGDEIDQSAAAELL
jgi:hypothetical protein